MEENKSSLWERWGMLVVLFVGGGLIYVLPWSLRAQFYEPLRQALGFTNTEFGLLTTAYGVAAMLSYFPGGWLADRFSARKLLTISFVLTGLGGLYYTTYPPLTMAIALHFFWGVTTVLTYWAALIKATRLLGSATEQGKFFGFLEGGRNLVGALVAMFVLFVFSKLGSDMLGLTWVIRVYAILTLAVGALTWFVFKDTPVEVKPGRLVDDIIKVVKYPKVWMMAVIILCGYCCSTGQAYVNAYATTVFGASAVFAGTIYIVMQWVGPFASGGAGIIADKISVSKAILYSFILLLGVQLIYIFLPVRPGLLYAVLVNAIFWGVAMYALRGLYYGMLEEADIPIALSGAAIGWASTIGYTPDVFLSVVTGHLLDKYPGVLGFKLFFVMMACLAVVGLITTIWFRAVTKEKREQIFKASKEVA